MFKPIRLTQRARQHRIGRHHVYAVIAHGDMQPTESPATGLPGLSFTGTVHGRRGSFDLHVVVIEEADCFLVIHAQPTYR